jgi:molecular chaperone GrpE (heat shock protein)
MLDNLERSLEHIPAELIDNVWVEWNKSIVRAMQKVVSDFGILPMNPVWEEVDPDFHDVISQIPHELTTIQAEIEKWYMRGERALRHAKVIVGNGQIVV